MIESHSIDVTASPVGRLKSAEAKWKTAGANDYLMKVVSEGYLSHLESCRHPK